MGREERRRRFQEALLNTLYPPSSPSPSPPPLAHHDELGPTTPASSGSFDVNLIPDDYGLSVETSGPSSPASPASNNDDDSGARAEKLGRAQRKRLRKRRLKEDASRRGNIIGPLLPASSCTGGEEEGSRSPDVRLNAGDDPGDGKRGSCDDHGKKLRRRRMAKRIAREENESHRQNLPPS